MKEVTFRTDFPHAVKSQAQKQLRETYLCLKGGGEELEGGRRRRGGNKKRRKLQEVFPKEVLWYIPQLTLCVCSSQGGTGTVLLGSCSSLLDGTYLCLPVFLLLFWLVPAATKSKHLWLFSLVFHWFLHCILHSRLVISFPLLPLWSLPRAAGSPSKHPWLYRQGEEVLLSNTRWMYPCSAFFSFKIWWSCLCIAFYRMDTAFLCPACPTLGAISSALVPSLLPQVHAVHMAPYASLMAAGYKFMFSVPTPLSWSWMPSQCLATVPGPVESLICQFMARRPMGRVQFSAAPRCTERSSLAGRGSVWWHCGPRRPH